MKTKHLLLSDGEAGSYCTPATPTRESYVFSFIQLFNNLYPKNLRYEKNVFICNHRAIKRIYKFIFYNKSLPYSTLQMVLSMDMDKELKNLEIYLTRISGALNAPILATAESLPSRACKGSLIPYLRFVCAQ